MKGMTVSKQKTVYIDGKVYVARGNSYVRAK